MTIPNHSFRCPTRAAIDSLSARFGFSNDPGMQDWEFEVADASRIDEFLEAYESGELDDDERFTLMQTIIQSFENLNDPLETDARWSGVLELLDANIALHGYSAWYWSCEDALDPRDAWQVSPWLRK